MKLARLTGFARRKAIEARTLAVWGNGGPDRRYRPRAYNAAGNWQVYDTDLARMLSDDDLLRISVRRLIETPCRAPPPAPLPDQTPAKP